MPPLLQPSAVQLILEDHQALATVLRALGDSVEQARRSARRPDFDELRAMLFYLDEMPARMHHASESELLFPKIRERCPALRPVLARLEAEHERGESSVRELEHALTAWELMGEVHRESFQLLLQTHATVYLGHMEVEESYVLPVAADYLSPADWRELAEALARQRGDTDAAMTQGHRALFARITARTSCPDPTLQK
ncbi:hemerythrin domain-containing protein [Variovorax sp.]|jgi:hemerythrin-like domain-containing protein|uniref:hemerythrin domain-containing protein n=1 Tax=Variovorax sp. TaxID=1871043 RepID=UPI001204AB2B|nr:hemerythrin domain-containing protein [Variovorax sp.]TAJ58773.1 MAG: hemerythrin domain-containing protein [Variovorax sp.]